MRRLVPILVSLALTVSALAQERVTADQLWSALQQGNRQFVAGKVSYENLAAERKLLENEQMPPITILACADSRVPPELIFNQSIGGLFVVRTAGNVADEFGIASIEYAIAHGWTKLLVVMGHEHCGAVKASLGGADPQTPSLTALARRIRSSFVGIPYDSRDEANVRKAIEANTRAAAAQLLAGSVLIRDAATTDGIRIVTAYYEFSTGAVKKLE